jgi:type I restriction enzyme R subunit
LYVISNGVDTNYISNDEGKLNYNFAFFWTNDINERINNLSEFTKSCLNPCHISKVISRYMVVNQTDKKIMVMRPYQIYAVEKLVDRATETKNNGYVWHATGLGKTLTSFKLSQILSNQADVTKVVFLVDRKDLDAQTLSKFNKFEPGSVDMTTNTYKLVEQLRDSSQRLYNKNILETHIKLPNIVEQQKIGVLLNSVDNLITLHQRKYELLEKMKKGYMQRLFA